MQIDLGFSKARAYIGSIIESQCVCLDDPDTIIHLDVQLTVNTYNSVSCPRLSNTTPHFMSIWSLCFHCSRLSGSRHRGRCCYLVAAAMVLAETA